MLRGKSGPPDNDTTKLVVSLLLVVSWSLLLGYGQCVSLQVSGRLQYSGKPVPGLMKDEDLDRTELGSS